VASSKKRRTALFDAPDWADTVAVRAMMLGDALVTAMTLLLADFGVTPLQYNVLRILYVRDEDHEGLPVGTIGGALVSATADVSRLIDRLEKMAYLERVRDGEDRRVVKVRLTKQGFATVERIHGPLVSHHNALLARIPKADLEQIAGDLGRILAQLPK
jgi:DNA-binding MarR family transcriptional regulator